MKGFATFLTASVLAAFGGGAATTTPAAVQESCVNITRSLAVGSKGEDVSKLQVFLKVQKSGYFGPLTRQKLTEWQISKKIITSAKTVGAGTTGPKTRAAMKCGASVLPAAPAQVPAAVFTPATTSTAIAPAAVPAATTPAPTSGGGGGGSISVPSVSPIGYACTEPGDEPVASSCDIGAWELSFDEAGCIVWACLSVDDRG